METKETGDEAPKAAEIPPKGADATPAGDAKPAEEAAAKPAEEAAAKPAEEAAAKPAEAPAEALASQSSIPLAQGEPAAPSARGTYFGVAALVILLGGVLGTILIARHNDTAHNKAPAHQKKKGPKKDTTPWNVGDKVPVVITLVREDTENVVCAAKEEIEGQHCAFENKDTPWSKGDSKDDKTLLRPYATTGQRRLIGSGLWSQLPEPLPEKRFAVKCTFAIQGKLEHPWVKFRQTMEFKEVKEAWFAGALTDCAIVTPGAGASAHPSAAPAATK